MRKSDYAKMFTLRADGYYQKKVKGKTYYDKDPEQLYKKLQELSLPKERTTFKQVAEAWQQEHREEISERTWNNYKPHYDDLIARFGSRPVEEISAQDILSDLNRLKNENYSATIVKTRKTIMTQILDKAVIEVPLPFNPARAIQMPKGLKRGKRSAPTAEEMKKISESIDKPFGFFPFFLLLTGMRKSEALALTKDDIDLIHKTIKVTKSLTYVDGAHPKVKSPKTEAGVRIVPIVAGLYPPLVIYMANIDSQILFPSPKSNRNPGGGYMTKKAFDVAWENYCEATGLNITAHQLRHGAATIMYEAGVDPYTAQRILGHAQVTTTMAIYTELRNKQQDKSIKKFDRESRKYAKGV